jgi:hypothetical protein
MKEVLVQGVRKVGCISTFRTLYFSNIPIDKEFSIMSDFSPCSTAQPSGLPAPGTRPALPGCGLLAH